MVHFLETKTHTHTQMILSEAIALVGGLSKPSKMPCQGYSLPASACKAGAKLAKQAGTICASCYACKGNYLYPSVRNALSRRLKSLSDPRWVDAMTLAISGTEGSGFFRWHDSGDLQGAWHFAMICEVARRTPTIKHWLPTREFAMVKQYLEDGGSIPSNLTVRFSAIFFDGPTPDRFAKDCGVQVSGAAREGFNCPAWSQGNKCLACRKCWDRESFSVIYRKH